jgi:hypothetical protein
MTVILQFQIDEGVLAEDRWRNPAGADPAVVETTYFRMPVRFCVDGAELFGIARTFDGPRRWRVDRWPTSTMSMRRSPRRRFPTGCGRATPSCWSGSRAVVARRGGTTVVTSAISRRSSRGCAVAASSASTSTTDSAGQRIGQRSRTPPASASMPRDRASSPCLRGQGRRLDVRDAVDYEDIQEMIAAPLPRLAYGSFPGQDNDGVHAVTLQLPDEDGALRPHPH